MYVSTCGERHRGNWLKKSDALLLAKLTISMLIKAREQKSLECELSSITTTLISWSLTRLETANGEASKEKKEETDKKCSLTIYDTVGFSESDFKHLYRFKRFPIHKLLQKKGAGTVNDSKQRD